MAINLKQLTAKGKRGVEQTQSKRYTREQVIKEFKQVGHTPSDAEIKNWIKYGKPGQIITENDPKRFEVRNINGNQVRVYKDLSNIQGSFDLSNKEGQIFAVPRGTSVASGKNYKLLQSADGFDYYVNKGRSSGGVLGKISEVTGIKEIREIPEKIIPEEAFAAVDPLGISTPILFGKEKSADIRSNISKYTGLKEDEIASLQQYGTIAASIALGIMGQPYAGAALQTSRSAADVAEGTKSVKEALTTGAIAFGTAALVDGASRYMASRSAANAPQLRGPYQPKSEFFDAASSKPFGADSVVPIGDVGSPVTSSNVFEVGGIPIDTTGMTPFESATIRLKAAEYSSKASLAQAEAAKGFFDSPANIIAVTGLAAGIAIPFVQGYVAQRAEERKLERLEELNQQEFEQQKELLAMKFGYESELASASVGDVGDVDSVYEKGSIE